MSFVEERLTEPAPHARAGFVTTPDGAKLYVEERGTHHDGGTPLLLLRPLAGSVGLWGAFREALAAQFRVVAFDPLGVGRSGAAPLDVSTRSMAREALCVLDGLGVERAHVFGLSLGAMVATWLALDAPSRVARLVLASAGAAGMALTVGGLARVVSVATAALAPDEAVTPQIAEAMLSDEVRAADPARVAEVRALAEHDPARRPALVLHTLAAARHDARAEVGSIETPTLVLTGDHDALLGPRPSLDLAAQIPGALHSVIAGAGHELTLDRPEASARAVAAFLRG